METIDLTPTWCGLIPVIVRVIRDSESPTARDEVIKELMRLARFADEHNARKSIEVIPLC